MTLCYADGTTEVIDMTEDMITGFDNTVVGSLTLHVFFEGRTTTFIVQIVATPKISTWKHDGIGWWYQNSDGTYPANSWKKIDNVWYYFNGSGVMASNQWVGNYYLQADGSMATNKWIGNYYVGADGAWIP